MTEYGLLEGLFCGSDSREEVILLCHHCICAELLSGAFLSDQGSITSWAEGKNVEPIAAHCEEFA